MRSRPTVEFVLPLWAREARCSKVRWSKKMPDAVIVQAKSLGSDTVVARDRSNDDSNFEIRSLIELPTRPSRSARHAGALPHFRFANASNEDLLVGFIRDYGPVLASLDLAPADAVANRTRGQWHAVAVESLRDLSDERLRFASLLRLVQTLTAEDFDRDAALSAAAEVVAMFGEGEPPDVPVDQLPASRVEKMDALRIEKWLLEGLLVFLSPFAFKPRAVVDPDSKRPVVLVGPDRVGKGIRSALYGMLLLELQGPGGIRSCANPRCASFFRPARQNVRYCNPDCQGRAKFNRSYDRRKTARTAQLPD